MSNLVLQHLTRVSMLGMDLDARTDLADEPCIEAETLGVLLEYQRPRDCRDLVRRLLDRGRLSCTAPGSTAPHNSADNSGLSSAEHRAVDVYPVEVIEPHGVRLGTTEQLWLTERACLLVATASETDRAWQVRTALVDFFLACRRERTNASSISPALAHDIEKSRAETRAMLDEVRAIRSEVVHVLGIDARVRQLEQRAARKPSVASLTTPLEALAAAVLPSLAQHPEGLTTLELLELARPAIDGARGRHTHTNPLGKELSALMNAGYPIERAWGHGHIARWRRRNE